MSIDINLVVEKSIKTPREIRLRRLRAISYGTLITLAILSILLFLTNIRLSVNSVQTQRANIIKTISPYDQLATKLFLLQERLKDISFLVDNRKGYGGLTEQMLSGSSGVTIDGYKMGGDEFQVIAASSSLISLNDFLNQLIDLSEQKKLSNISIENLRLGNFGFEMIVTGKII